MACPTSSRISPTRGPVRPVAAWMSTAGGTSHGAPGDRIGAGNGSAIRWSPSARFHPALTRGPGRRPADFFVLPDTRHVTSSPGTPPLRGGLEVWDQQPARCAESVHEPTRQRGSCRVEPRPTGARARPSGLDDPASSGRAPHFGYLSIARELGRPQPGTAASRPPAGWRGSQAHGHVVARRSSCDSWYTMTPVMEQRRRQLTTIVLSWTASFGALAK